MRRQHSATGMYDLPAKRTASRTATAEEPPKKSTRVPDTHNPVCRMLEALSIGRHLKPKEQSCWLVVPLLLMSVSENSLRGDWAGERARVSRYV